MNPRGPHERTTDEDRFAAIVASEARGEPVSPGDAAFRKRHQESHPDAAAEAELWSALGGLGAESPTAELRDAQLLARVLERASPPSPAPKAGARRRGVAVTFGVVALAATLMVAFAAELREIVAPPAPLPATTGGTPSPPVPSLPPSDPPVPEVPLETAPPRPLPPPAPLPPPKPTEVRAPSADELLRRAQEHLGAARTTEAVQAYRELVARYPASPEASAAVVTLGQLALQQGHAEEALAQFDRYLRGSGPLDEEARYGRIAALHQQGRASAEAAAIEDFLARHPGSVHAERLRARTADPR